MLTTFILTLTFGITLGFLLATYLFLYHFKINCPKCKQPKSLKEIMLFHWKDKQITGSPCLKCRQVKSKIDISND